MSNFRRVAMACVSVRVCTATKEPSSSGHDGTVGGAEHAHCNKLPPTGATELVMPLVFFLMMVELSLHEMDWKIDFRIHLGSFEVFV